MILFFMHGKLIRHYPKKLTKNFQDNNLSLQSKKVSNTEEGKELEFLDMLHKIKSSEKMDLKQILPSTCL